MFIKSTGGSHLVQGVWVTPDGPPTQIPDAEWPKYQAIAGIIQVPAPATPTVAELQAQLSAAEAELHSVEQALPAPH